MMKIVAAATSKGKRTTLGETKKTAVAKSSNSVKKKRADWKKTADENRLAETMKRNARKSVAASNYFASKKKRASTWKSNVLPRSKLNAALTSDVANRTKLEHVKLRKQKIGLVQSVKPVPKPKGELTKRLKLSRCEGSVEQLFNEKPIGSRQRDARMRYEWTPSVAKSNVTRSHTRTDTATIAINADWKNNRLEAPSAQWLPTYVAKRKSSRSVNAISCSQIPRSQPLQVQWQQAPRPQLQALRSHLTKAKTRRRNASANPAVTLLRLPRKLRQASTNHQTSRLTILRESVQSSLAMSRKSIPVA
jgi:hypothetical protein